MHGTSNGPRAFKIVEIGQNNILPSFGIGNTSDIKYFQMEVV